MPTRHAIESNRRSIVLIGLRGAGKSTVGRRLAQRMKLKHVDTDERITARAGKSIADIFREDGESAFRAWEKEIIEDVTRDQPQVISAGGGVVLDPENVARLRAAALVVWLTAPPETLWHRISRDAATPANRPALTADDGLSELKELLQQRQERYRAAAHLTIETGNRTTDEIVSRLLEHLRAADE